MEASRSCDVAIIGGGPAGATAALCLSRYGHDVVVVEKERFPRFHIGESLLPHSLELFDELGIHDEIKKAGFTTKLGAEFVSRCGEHVRKFYFRNTSVQGPPMAYQVARADFDHLLLKRARVEGAEVREETTVSEVANRGETYELSTVARDGTRAVLSCKMLVDASGQDTFLASRMRLKRVDPESRRYAVFGHFKGVARTPGDDAGNILIIPFGAGHWFWFIPLADDITSIGAVVTKETVRDHRADLAGFLMRTIHDSPVLVERMKGASLAWPVRTLSDFSYESKRYVGDRFVMIGDAAAFLDPVFSSGVHMAMTSAQLAAKSIHQAFAKNDFRAAMFRDYERHQKAHIRRFFRLIRAYYRPSFLQMFMNPTQKLDLQRTVTSILAGCLEPSWTIRWRLEIFYLVGALLARLPRNRVHTATCSHGCSVHDAGS